MANLISSKQLEKQIEKLFTNLCIYLSYNEREDPEFKTMQAFHTAILNIIIKHYKEHTIEIKV